MTPDWIKRDIMRPANEFERSAVRQAQRVLRLEETGEMDEATVSHLRGFQVLFGLRPTGMLDKATATKLEAIRNRYA
jgi:hypothetical protein